MTSARGAVDGVKQGTGRAQAAGPLRASVWRTARGELALDRARVMGVLNLTPDSFWRGSRQADVDAALRTAERMLNAGAVVLDVGGESTRPGAQRVSEQEEHARVEPVVAALVARFPEVLISVDTTRSSVALAALDAGAAVINDVSAFRLDPHLADVVARRNAGVVLMHSRGTIESMASYELAEYGDVVHDVIAELGDALGRAQAAGISAECVVLDPGLGFAKRTTHSLTLLARLDELVELGFGVLVGASRKRFVGDAAGGLAVEERLEGTLAACVAGRMRGATLFRVHDVEPAVRALAVADAILEAQA